MIARFLFMVAVLTFSMSLQTQNPIERLQGLIGNWEGTGEGFGNSKSNISAKYNWMNENQSIQY